MVDCYKRSDIESLIKVKHIDFIDYALFISFFPQLIAGPIVHHKEMMPQFAALLDKGKDFVNWEYMAKGLSYKETTTTVLKVVGDFNYKDGTIFVETDTDAGKRKIVDLLKDFQGLEIELTAKVKKEEELDVPEEENDTDE